jgi:epoxyqueuosine reductase QueG
MDLNNHPTVVTYRNRPSIKRPETVSAEWIKSIAREAGADEAGVVDIDSPLVIDQKSSILSAFPHAKTLVSFCCRLNSPQVQSRDRSLIDGEFISVDKEMPEIARHIVRALRKNGISSITPSEGFPQDMNRWPGRMFTVSHKPVAEAAGLGKIGHHRLLIHPEFGSHIALGTLIMDAAVNKSDSPIDFNPCVSCGLCTGTCPTGAIEKDGSFNFLKCLVHAYRDRLGGFMDWIDALVTSENLSEYRAKRSDSESLAVWQSLAYGGGYRCGYCMSVCPAGSEVIGSFIDEKNRFIRDIVKPLKEREETVYILPGSENEDRLKTRFPMKKSKVVS